MSAQEWDSALQEMLVKEKELTRARDALAAMRRRMPWTPVEKQYEFEGPEGKGEPARPVPGSPSADRLPRVLQSGVHGWPEHACVGCSLMADHVGNLAHLNARDTTFVYASPVPQADIERVKPGWAGSTSRGTYITDDFDSRLRRGRMARHQRIHPLTGDRVFRTYFINNRATRYSSTPGTSST